VVTDRRGCRTSPVEPVIVLATADVDERDRLQRELDRYRGDYRIESAVGVDAATDLLVGLRAAGGEVAMVLADLAVGAWDGVDVLVRARAVARTARCVLLLDWGLRGDQFPSVERAQTLGVVDTVLTKPKDARDEEFHTAITEDLGEWAWTTSPVVEAVRIVGGEQDRSPEIRDVLERLGVPCGVHGTSSPVGAAIVERAGPEARLPLVEVMESTILSDPTNRELAVTFGVSVDVSSTRFDLAVVGAGPAGLGAAVYGASEGLSTLVVEAEAFGGQAGTSSMIRNYLGFPRGITGRQLGRRAVLQSLAFGARFDLARRVVGLEPGRLHRLTLDDGAVASADAVVLACGVTYRRLGVASLEALVGSGVFYGAATGQARALQDADVVVVGAGNSGGQAAVHLARYAARVTLVARGASLPETMSAYLVGEIEANPRVVIRTGTEVTDGGGDGRLEWLELTERAGRTSERIPAAGLFVLIGTTTRTDWLPPAVQRDGHGFVLTGGDVDRRTWPLGRPPLALETSVPGVFAAGDVRANDVKRVAAAVGEGAVSVPMVHRYLREMR
jgi:thioredoxin reductase (NADPH)